MTDEQISALRVVADLMDQLEAERPSDYFYNGYEESLSFKETGEYLRELSGIPRPTPEPSTAHYDPAVLGEITREAMRVMMNQLHFAVSLDPLKLEGDPEADKPKIGDVINLRKPMRYTGHTGAAS